MGQQTAIDSRAAQSSTHASPRTLRDYRDAHRGGSIVVCGCGVSLSQLTRPQDFVTIGVNDVGRLFQPNYLVVLNPRAQFSRDRFQYVEQSGASAIFTQLNLGVTHPNIVRFRLGRRGGVDVADPDTLPYTRNSPYVAACLAMYMGAKRIGIIGVDFTRDHFFAKTGTHVLERELSVIDNEYKRLYEACAAQDIELFNLSDVSRLTAMPKIPLEEFSRRPANRRSLDIVSYSVTPVAGVPVILSQCIAARTLHTCRTVWATHSYGNGVRFDTDVEWTSAPKQAEELLRAADLIVVHNGKVDRRHKALLDGKPVITMAHNYMWNVDKTFVERGMPGVVVGQYQATLPEFSSWRIVPNPVPAWDADFLPGEKNPELTICYTPSGKHEKYPSTHRLYWHAKGYATTTRVLESLARRYPIRLETLGGGQASHAQSMAMKRRSHIVIDECVTGSYHRNSLEGLATGCVVINGLGLQPAIREVFDRCSGTSESPFVYADLESLQLVLERLIEQGSQAVAESGARNRTWLEKHWDFEQQWNEFWEPVVDLALERARRAGYASTTRALERRHEPTTGQRAASRRISAVICHGGCERLPNLGTCLASLRQSPAIDEIILVDMSAEPFAADLARRWADQYIFLRNQGLFERARCLNLGSALAQNDLVLWLDNDLLMAPDFFTGALAEMERRKLDFLVPYFEARYLSEKDSERVRAGTANPADCPPENVLRGALGGTGLVKSAFLREYGPIPEGFSGWGGEDDAWWHKARLLGHAALTDQRHRTVYHLHHDGGGNWEQKKVRNPNYSANYSLLQEVWSQKSREQFLHRFPPSVKASWNWVQKRVVFLSEIQQDGVSGASIANELSTFADLRVDAVSLEPAESGFANLGSANLDSADAIVILDSGLAADLLASEAFQPLQKKTIALVTTGIVTPATAEVLRGAAAVVCAQPADAAAPIESTPKSWAESGPTFWTTGRRPDAAATEWHIARALLQPLSLLFGEASIPQPSRPQSPGMRAPAPEPVVDLPVWMYWEGDRPEWIERCHNIALRSAADVRLLSPEDFARLWDSDLDIDLRPLHPGQRADFVRAYLLARFGGLWLDSDCVVMQPLDCVLGHLRHYDFIAHRERTGNWFANDFVGAARDSKIAAQFYANVCKTLRSKKRIGWIEIGACALSPAIEARLAPCLELKVERIQPLCWSAYAPFLKIANGSEHEKAFDNEAICYMLSNQTMQRELHTADLSSHLLREGSFFCYLLDRAKAALAADNGGVRHEQPAQGAIGFTQPHTSIFSAAAAQARKSGAESVSGPGSSLGHTAEIRRLLPILLQDLDVRSVLDAGCGDYNWLRAVDSGLIKYIGADLVPEVAEQNQQRYSCPGKRFISLDVVRDPLPPADLILCRDCLVLLSFEDVAQALRNFRRSGARYLLTTTFPAQSSNRDGSAGTWRPLNLQAAPFNLPPPLRILNEKCEESNRAFSDKSLALWRLEDIAGDFALAAQAQPAPAEIAVQTLSSHDTHAGSSNGSATEPNGLRDLTVIIPISIVGNQRERLRNLKACLSALQSQDLERGRYSIVVVEQDSQSSLEEQSKQLADKYIFAKNQYAFNKSWAFNLGAATVRPRCALCLIDADVLPGPGFLRSGLEQIENGARAVRPYAQITYLDPNTTERAIASRTAGADRPFCTEEFQGPSFPHSKGGCLFVDAQLFFQIGGLDERFRGFGYEDTEFWDRVARHTEIRKLSGTLLHMHHPRTVSNGSGNAQLYRRISNGSAPCWAGPMGDLNKYAHEEQAARRPAAPSRRPNPAPAAGNGHATTATGSMTPAFVRMKRHCEQARMESISGPGSSLAQTAEIRRHIPGLLRKLGVSSLLDCGCGDFNWMREVDLAGITYSGIDLLEEVAHANASTFSSGQRRFIAADFVNDPLPKTDVILCRDVLVHFDLALALAALHNFKASQSAYMLVTHFVRTAKNSEIVTGGWRPLNLCVAPFNLPQPLSIIDEHCTENKGRYSDKSLALWRLSDLQL